MLCGSCFQQSRSRSKFAIKLCFQKRKEKDKEDRKKRRIEREALLLQQAGVGLLAFPLPQALDSLPLRLFLLVMRPALLQLGGGCSDEAAKAAEADRAAKEEAKQAEEDRKAAVQSQDIYSKGAELLADAQRLRVILATQPFQAQFAALRKQG
jgi:hypothetical protein